MRIDLRQSISGLCLAATLFSGCLWREHDQRLEAHQAYRACLQANAGDRDKCRAEEADLNRLSDEYEARARQAWGCEHSPDCDRLPDDR